MVVPQRSPDGRWTYRMLGPGVTVTLANGAVLAVDAIYEGVLELDGE